LEISYRNFTIILPTLNEDRTIGEILRYILVNYRETRVIVADDGSTDNTKRIVKKFAKRSKNIMLFDRSAKGLRRGLTASVVDAIRLSKTKFAIVMDADMQHPPSKIREVGKKLEKGDMLVVATRAKVTKWSLYRKTISRALMYFGRFVLVIEGKETCGDIFSGFFGVDRNFLISVFNKNKQRFVGEGYKVLFDFLKCIDKGTISIGEVPIIFGVRKSGSSKAGFMQGIALLKSFAT
jgi:dolichol-phosphate mannosyltransferase